MPDEPPQRSSTYTELGGIRPGHPEYQAWSDWLRECGFPEQQVCHDGWVARDVYRNTVSAKIYSWKPDDKIPIGARNASTIARRDGDGYPDCEYGVHTIQLSQAPPPFPEPEGTREEQERAARRSLATLWSKLAQAGDLADEDRPNVAEHQHSIDRILRLLDEILVQRGDRRQDDDPVGVGVTYGQAPRWENGEELADWERELLQGN